MALPGHKALIKYALIIAIFKFSYAIMNRLFPFLIRLKMTALNFLGGVKCDKQ